MPHVLVQYPVYMQRVVVVPSARIFLAERQEDPFMMKILTPCELLSLGVDPSIRTNQTITATARSVVIKAIKAVWRYYELIIDRFHMTSRRPYLCTKN